MSYRVELTARAAKQLEALPQLFRKKVGARIDALAKQPRPSNSKKLTDRDNLYRLRVGDYRVIYQIEDRIVLITVIRIGHRRDLYR